MFFNKRYLSILVFIFFPNVPLAEINENIAQNLRDTINISFNFQGREL